ncbi:LuxR family transcriptional regulator [Nocardiopsis nanhaiensis]
MASRGVLPSPSDKIRPNLTPEEIDLLAEIATGANTEVAARNLELDKGTLRRRIRRICDVLGVDTPIQAVVWAAWHKLI